MTPQIGQIVTMWTRASISIGHSRAEDCLQIEGQDYVWRIVWTQCYVDMTREKVLEFAEVQNKEGRTVQITEIWLRPPSEKYDIHRFM